MRAGETELQMCVRHVAEQEDRVARQDVRVERLREGARAANIKQRYRRAPADSVRHSDAVRGAIHPSV